MSRSSSKYFGKNWKFFWRQDSLIGNWYGVLLNRLGMRFLNLGRVMIRRGGGTFRKRYYSNCSWCGDGDNIEKGAGMHHSHSRKGSRCMRVHKTCDLQRLV